MLRNPRSFDLELLLGFRLVSRDPGLGDAGFLATTAAAAPTAAAAAAPVTGLLALLPGTFLDETLRELRPLGGRGSRDVFPGRAGIGCDRGHLAELLARQCHERHAAGHGLSAAGHGLRGRVDALAPVAAALFAPEFVASLAMPAAASPRGPLGLLVGDLGHGQVLFLRGDAPAAAG